LDLQDSLQEQVDRQRREIHTDGYSQSISEWISLYEGNEIDIHPEFQRFFRWTPLQKTKLIESILLGIPIPQIFVSQRADGVWDVVDGLQRLSTIYQFVGILKNEDGTLIDPLVLEGTNYLPLLGGKKWQDDNDPQNSLTSALRLLIKRSKIDVSIILKESDENSKYELFQRLNTGGSPLSPQEVRNSILVMLNKDLYRWMREISYYEDFREVVALTDRAIEEQYDMELVVRFLVFRKLAADRLTNIGDMGQFLTDAVMDFARNNTLDLTEEKAAFETTFRLLREQVEGDAFHKYDTVKQKFLGGFIISAFEAVALGLGYHYPKVAHEPPDDLATRIKVLWLDKEFTENSGAGVRASSRVPHTIPVGRRIFGA
jgi:hypothetical protein